MILTAVPMIPTMTNLMTKVKRRMAAVGGTISPHLMMLTARKKRLNPHDEEWAEAQTSPKNSDQLSREKPVSLENSNEDFIRL
jgi:hypothetical protein